MSKGRLPETDTMIRYSLFDIHHGRSCKEPEKALFRYSCESRNPGFPAAYVPRRTPVFTGVTTFYEAVIIP